MKNLEKFIGLYPLPKTLRFELKPIGKTLEHIETKGLLQQDEERAQSYQRAKKIIDRFHKHFIEIALENLQLKRLTEFEELYFVPAEEKKIDSFQKNFEDVQKKLRKEIADSFKSGKAKDIFSKLDKKELFTELLENWLIEIEDKKEIETFKTFTTYFTGFHENRKNMYSDEAKSTAIAFRLIHENLPKFLDNSKIFEKLKNIPELYEKCEILAVSQNELTVIVCFGVSSLRKAA